MSSSTHPPLKSEEGGDSDSKGEDDWTLESISDEDEELDNSEEEEDSEEDEDNDKKAPAKKVWARFRPKPREVQAVTFYCFSIPVLGMGMMKSTVCVG